MAKEHYRPSEPNFPYAEAERILANEPNSPEANELLHNRHLPENLIRREYTKITQTHNNPNSTPKISRVVTFKKHLPHDLIKPEHVNINPAEFKKLAKTNPEDKKFVRMFQTFRSTIADYYYPTWATPLYKALQEEQRIIFAQTFRSDYEKLPVWIIEDLLSLPHERDTKITLASNTKLSPHHAHTALKQYITDLHETYKTNQKALHHKINNCSAFWQLSAFLEKNRDLPPQLITELWETLKTVLNINISNNNLENPQKLLEHWTVLEVLLSILENNTPPTILDEIFTCLYHETPATKRYVENYIRGGSQNLRIHKNNISYYTNRAMRITPTHFEILELNLTLAVLKSPHFHPETLQNHSLPTNLYLSYAKNPNITPETIQHIYNHTCENDPRRSIHHEITLIELLNNPNTPTDLAGEIFLRIPATTAAEHMNETKTPWKYLGHTNKKVVLRAVKAATMQQQTTPKYATLLTHESAYVRAAVTARVTTGYEQMIEDTSTSVRQKATQRFIQNLQ